MSHKTNSHYIQYLQDTDQGFRLQGKFDKYRCKVAPRINSFSNSFFIRTLNQWNELPLYLREINSFDKFELALKEHLWLILGLKPD